MNKLLIILMLLFANNAYAQKFNVNFYDVEYVRNYDGDTINFDIAAGVAKQFMTEIPAATDVSRLLPLMDALKAIPDQIRLKNIDTAEMRPRGKQNKDCEKRIAIKAKEYVRLSLSSAKVINLMSCSKGKYYRMVCDVIYDGKNLTLELLNKGYGYVYHGGTKEKYNWCAVN